MNPFTSPRPNAGPPRDAIPSPGAAVAVFTLALALNLLIAYSLNALGAGDGWALAVTPLVLLALVGIAIVVLGVRARPTLLLRLPSFADVLMAVPLALSLVVLNDQLSTLTQSLFELPEEIETSMRQLLHADSASEWVFKVATMGLGAAVSEELLFRGFIQNAFLMRMRRLQAVLWTAFLFMVIHTLPLPSFAAAGIVLGLTAIGARSIVVPIVVHFVNNVSSLVLVNVGNIDTLAEPVWIPPSILLPALAMFAISMSYFVRKMPEERSPEPGPRTEGAPETDNPTVLLPAPTMADELAGIPPGRRRLGWLVAVLSVGFGLLVLGSLIVYSVYAAEPARFRAVMIESVEQTSVDQLAPDAAPREAELRRAFRTASAASDRGALTFWDIVDIAVRASELAAERGIEDAEVDDLLALIRAASGTTDAPRRL